MVYNLLWFALGGSFTLLVVAASLALHRKRKGIFGRGLVVDDEMVRAILEHGEVFVEEEPLDLLVIEEEEERFWSEPWDEPTWE